MTAKRKHLLGLAILLVLGLSDIALGVRLNIEDFSWQRPHLPNVWPVAEIEEGHAEFQGHVRGVLRVDCDLDCQVQKGKQPLSLEDIENDMSYETLDVFRQVRIKTVVNVSDVSSEILRLNTSNAGSQQVSEIPRRIGVTHRRSKRAIFGYDTRFSLTTSKFSTMFPFSTAVKLSTGCAGVLVSPKHVLTSAHCIHNGKRYLKGVKKLRVGKIIKKKLKKRGKGRKKKGRKGRKNTNRQIVPTQATNNVTVLARSKRNAPQTVQKFKWTRAKKTHIPQSWVRSRGQRDANLMVEYDYAVIELRRPLGSDHMKIGISPVKEHLPRNQRIHFTAFDQGKNAQLLYRYCAVEEQSSDMMYHYCDAQRGTSGAGIYIRLYDRDTEVWDRRVIGIFSGHQWVDMGQAQPPKEYNTGVRITPLKFAQICFWTTGDYSQCREG